MTITTKIIDVVKFRCKSIEKSYLKNLFSFILVRSNMIMLNELEEIINIHHDDVNRNENSEKDIGIFTKLQVSTTTVTALLGTSLNIIDIAKYLPLDEVVIGIKLVYAGGLSSIIRGVAKMSKKKKDFYNQVTFTIRLPMTELPECSQRPDQKSSILISCKIFHNGTLHITGTHNLDEAQLCANLLISRLRTFKGACFISINPDFPILTSYDNLLFSSKGENIGWVGPSLTMNGEYVVLDNLELDDKSWAVLVSSKWVNNRKSLYTVEGELIGKRILKFNLDITRRHFEVKFGYLYSGHKIVGKEVIEFVDDYTNILDRTEKNVEYFKEKFGVVHCYSALPKFTDNRILKTFVHADFIVHMINTFFKAPFNICKNRLHRKICEQGYYSRFDGEVAAVNIRFHHNPLTIDNEETSGKCPDFPHGKGEKCNCKDISISCFNSGRLNVTGLANLEQGEKVYNFVKRFFTKFKDDIIPKIEQSHSNV